MSKQNPKPPIASTLATLAGCAIVFGSLLLTMVFPRLHLGVAIAIGAVLGTPLIVLGLRLHPGSEPEIGESKQFLRTRTELRGTLWGALGILTFMVCIFVPLCVFGTLFYCLPTGDGWLIVVVRMMCVLLAIGVSLWWIKFAIRTFPDRFRGKVSDKTIDAFLHEEPAEEPASIRGAVLKNWQILLITAAAFCVAFGIVDFDNPLLDLDVRPRRLRGIVRVLLWCRGNPNTVASSSWLVAIGAISILATRIRRAHQRSQMISDRNVT